MKRTLWEKKKSRGQTKNEGEKLRREGKRTEKAKSCGKKI